MRRGRLEIALTQEVVNVARAPVEIVGKLHLVVADRGNAGERSGDVALHLGAHRVQLEADVAECSRRRGAARHAAARGETERGRGRGGEKAAARLEHQGVTGPGDAGRGPA